jgi:hypothetical protein
VNPGVNPVAGFISFGANNHLSLVNVDRIVDPSRKMLVADGGSDLDDGNTSGGSVVFFKPEWTWYTVYITYRHRGDANTVSVDGHVDKASSADMGRLYPLRMAVE